MRVKIYKTKGKQYTYQQRYTNESKTAPNEVPISNSCTGRFYYEIN